MVEQQLTGSMSRVMDQLVAGARADRDGAVNTLDAVDRQTKAASAQIAETVVEVSPPTPEQLAARDVPRDDRFDPEEWSGAELGRSRPAPAAATAPVNGRTRRVDDDEEDNYPDTWLR